MLAPFRVDKDMIDALALGGHDDVAKELLRLAWSGDLKGVVRKPPRYSATTIQWHADCARLFYWPTLAGLESPPSKQQEFGTNTHKHAENYLVEGTLPPATPEGHLLSTGLSFLPMPRTPGLRVEDPFEYPVHVSTGKIMLTGTRDYWIEPQVLDAKGFKLGDHKTARSIRWAKSKAWLSANIQGNTYAFVTWEQLKASGFDQLRVVDKQWNYFYKDEKRSMPLRVVDSLEHVAEQFETVIKPNLDGMARMVRDAPRVGDVPAADKEVCGRYGGCPHYARCWDKGAGNMGAFASKFGKAPLAEKAQAIKAGGGAGGGAGAPINPPKPAPAPPIEVDQTDEQVEASGAEQADSPAVVEEQKKARARGKKVLKEAAEQLEEAMAPKGRAPSKRTPGANSGHNFWLFSGCAPTAGFTSEPIHVEKLLGEAQANAAESTGNPHYRMGGTYGVLETAFAAFMEENAIVGAIVVDPATIVARDVIGLLRAHASVVVERFQ